MVDVEICTLDLSQPGDVEMLSPDERQRAGRLLVPQIRKRFIAAHVGLREILSRVTGLAPAGLTFGTGEYGKPYLLGVSNAPHFSLSHSEDLALVAIAAQPVGVDLERTRPQVHLDHMGGLAFTDEERAALDSLDEPARTPAFYRVWTRKEAIVKADGRGFRIAKTFNTPIHASDAPITVGDWMVCDLTSIAGFAAAVAVNNPDSTGLTVRMV